MAHISPRFGRLSVGPYSGEMLTVDQLIALADQGTDVLDGSLQPIDSGVSDWPDVASGSRRCVLCQARSGCDGASCTDSGLGANLRQRSIFRSR